MYNLLRIQQYPVNTTYNAAAAANLLISFSLKGIAKTNIKSQQGYCFVMQFFGICYRDKILSIERAAPKS